MQVASVTTSSPSLRSAIEAWTYEDSSLVSHKTYEGQPFIGYTGAPKDIPRYDCILRMLAYGWELLGPPRREEWESGEITFGWWLTRR